MLTDTAIRNAKPTEKPVRLFDGGGLYLEVAPSGGRWWRLKYRVDGKEKRLSLGVYPDVGLKEARDRRDDARKLLAAGVDPGAQRKAEKATRAEMAANTFEAVAREWVAMPSDKRTEATSARTLKRLERSVFPWLGARRIGEIKSPELLAVLRRIESSGKLTTAHKMKHACGQIFRYAVATGRAEYDPTRDLREALSTVKAKHHSAVTDPKAVGGLLRAIDSYQGSFAVACALRLAPLVFVRPGELRKAEWADIDLDAEEWRYTVTKTDTAHIVPLSRQAVAILKELQPLTVRSRFVFPSIRANTRPMSENTINAALRRMGYAKDEMTGHGFRAMARTILDEVLGFRPDYIEHQLAHAVKDPNGRAYNRATHLPERRKMMQAWADYLDTLKAGAEVIPLRRGA